MGLKPKRRDPRRRRTIPREVPMEVEDLDPVDETADIFYRATKTDAHPSTVRVEIDPAPDTSTE